MDSGSIVWYKRPHLQSFCPDGAKAQVELCHSLHLLKVCILGLNSKTRLTYVFGII